LRAQAEAEANARRLAVAQEQWSEYLGQKEQDAAALLSQAQQLQAVLAQLAGDGGGAGNGDAASSAAAAQLAKLVEELEVAATEVGKAAMGVWAICCRQDWGRLVGNPRPARGRFRTASSATLTLGCRRCCHYCSGERHAEASAAVSAAGPRLCRAAQSGSRPRQALVLRGEVPQVVAPPQPTLLATHGTRLQLQPPSAQLEMWQKMLVSVGGRVMSSCQQMQPESMPASPFNCLPAFPIFSRPT
jgi:hypothetical protein